MIKIDFSIVCLMLSRMDGQHGEFISEGAFKGGIDELAKKNFQNIV